jgi:hypothetical protein
MAEQTFAQYIAEIIFSQKFKTDISDTSAFSSSANQTKWPQELVS